MNMGLPLIHEMCLITHQYGTWEDRLVRNLASHQADKDTKISMLSSLGWIVMSTSDRHARMVKFALACQYAVALCLAGVFIECIHTSAIETERWRDPHDNNEEEML